MSPALFVFGQPFSIRCDSSQQFKQLYDPVTEAFVRWEIPAAGLVGPHMVTRKDCVDAKLPGFLQARLLWDEGCHIQVNKMLLEFGGPAVPVRTPPHLLHRLPKLVETVLVRWRDAYQRTRLESGFRNGQSS
ncbi:hypothetical protein PM082_003456 [Marasmius tenuissimus]|nr:hypothetical protein PM082_003456 [Marasmius tenuissimus]